MSNLRGAVTDRAYAAGWRLVRALPEGTARRWFDRGGDWAARRSDRRAEPSQLRRNLARVLGVPPAEVPAELIAASMRSYARYWREAFRLPTMDHVALGRSELLPVEGREFLDGALAAGKGMILALPHSGNYDMAGLWLVQNYARFATVAERLQPESLYDRFMAYRESLGFEVFPLTGGAEPPFPKLAERLRDNGIVCLMGERDLTGRGVPVTFFGERTWLPAGAAKLAVETGAALLPVHLWFTEMPDGREAWGLKVEAPLDVSHGVAAATQALADRFAANIAAHPADWHMLQPLWEGDLSPERLARIAAVQSGRGGSGSSAGRSVGDAPGAAAAGSADGPGGGGFRRAGRGGADGGRDGARDARSGGAESASGAGESAGSGSSGSDGDEGAEQVDGEMRRAAQGGVRDSAGVGESEAAS